MTFHNTICGDNMIVEFTSTYVQSIPITSKIVGSNSVHDEVYLIQHYVIKFVCDLYQVGGLALCTPVSCLYIITGGIKFEYHLDCIVLGFNNIYAMYIITDFFLHFLELSPLFNFFFYAKLSTQLTLE